MSGEDGISYDDHSWPPGWTVRHFDSTGSTNDDLISLCERGAAGDRFALVTDHQTAGRGRLDRRWDAPPGANLLVSLLFTEVPTVAARLTQLVGLAAVHAVEATTGLDHDRLGLKWPNDVLLDDRKLAGVLAQRSAGTGAVVVGLGLNVAWSPDGASDLGAAIGTRELLASLLGCVDELRTRPDHELVEAYRQRLMTVGRRVRVHLPGDRELFGEATDVDVDGRLIVEDSNGTRHALDAGDVVHVRPL